MYVQDSLKRHVSILVFTKSTLNQKNIKQNKGDNMILCVTICDFHVSVTHELFVSDCY